MSSERGIRVGFGAGLFTTPYSLFPYSPFAIPYSVSYSFFQFWLLQIRPPSTQPLILRFEPASVALPE